jgi:hypothetical protein
MRETVNAVPAVAIGAGSAFELRLQDAEGGVQSFPIDLDAIPGLVQSLAAIAWASQTSNRPSPGTVLTAAYPLPVRKYEVGTIEGSPDPVLAVELFGGVNLALHFTVEDGAEAGRRLTRTATARMRN